MNTVDTGRGNVTVRTSSMGTDTVPAASACVAERATIAAASV
jgi:hypothetical protein